MKHPISNAPPRRLAKPRKQVQLNLRRRPEPESPDGVEAKIKSSFWKWVCLVALFHILIIALCSWVYEMSPRPQPPEQFISLLPAGDVVKGTPGTQSAPKIGPSTPAPTVHPAAPAAVPPQPVAKNDQTPLVNPPKPTPKPVPAKPKIKVDLHLVDGPVHTTEKHVTKPKPHPPKPAVATPPADAPDQAASTPDNTGLSKDQIAAKLGDKLQAAGTQNAEKTGVSGSDNSHANPFADFYAALRDQVMSKWASPNLTDETAVNPVVLIHVDKDGHVSPESVQLTRSSGNSSYDDSAVAAAKSLGYLYQPLPDGCPPDIHITFKLTR